MRHAITTILLSTAALLPAVSPAQSYLFTNGTLLTMTDGEAVQGNLRVVEQRIDAIGASLEPRQGDTVIDMKGGFLMPGLAEMHAHVPAPDQGEQYRDDVLFLWIANGITTARGMLGHPSHVDLRQALAAHDVLGPRLITSGPSFNGSSVSDPRQARQMVREQVAAGYDFLKIHPGLTRSEYDAVADEARRLGIHFAGHVPADVGLMHALDRGQVTIDHLDGFIEALASVDAGQDAGIFGMALAGQADLRRMPELSERMQAAGSSVVPTETLLENLAAADDPEALLERPENVYLPRDLLERYREAVSGRGEGSASARAGLELRKRIIRSLHDDGVGILLGSDSPQIFNVPGFSIHRELEAMVAAGLTPREALAAGTSAPARHFGREEDFGQLRPGLSADLVLLSADPTAEIGNTRAIEGVMVRGRWLDRTALDDGLGAIRERYSGP